MLSHYFFFCRKKENDKKLTCVILYSGSIYTYNYLNNLKRSNNYNFKKFLKAFWIHMPSYFHIDLLPWIFCLWFSFSSVAINLCPFSFPILLFINDSLLAIYFYTIQSFIVPSYSHLLTISGQLTILCFLNSPSNGRGFTIISLL